MTKRQAARSRSGRSPVRTSSPALWSVGLRVWLERSGAAVLGEGRADLLAGIERTHSISAAARAMGMSYRHAWLMVQAVNQSADAPLVEAAVGGVKGGGARLTDHGREVLAMYRRLTTDVHLQAAQSLSRIVAESTTTDAATAHVLHIAAAISLQEAVSAVLTEFALVRPDVRVHAVYGASNELADQIARGARIDVLLTGDPAHAERLATPTLPRAESVRRLATNGLAVIVPRRSTCAAENPRALLKVEFKRIAVADPACPLGRCTFTRFAQLKLDDQLRHRALLVDNSRGVPSAVRSGAAEVGVAFSSDAAQTPDCRVLFPIRSKQPAVEYFGVVTTASRPADKAADLLEFLVGDAAKRCFRRYGLGT